MSSPYDQRGSSRRRHGVWSHWVPLVVTVTVATVGVAAWIWSQRNNEEEEDAAAIPQDLDYENADYGDNPPYGASGDSRRAPSYADGDLRPGEEGYGTTQGGPQMADATGSTWGSRMSGALRRTPSPQQFLDKAGKTVAAGVAAAGTAVGSALAAIREEDKTAFADHETWSEEAEAKKERPSESQSREPGKRRRTVAIVVSADSALEDIDEDGYHEHASILSHIPKHNDFTKIKLFILIYSPGLKEAAGDTTGNLPPPSLSSSFSNIGHDQAQTPGDENKSPL
ncbi:putative peroxin 22-like protein [Phaeoacremonium minimum UCRPA7]|uniref:Putative peroxin 22-like protein n=1 Tax=Phaeoacremonium minimum (strain UCR-PA7) TaxID=1286976 RepID=R8BAA8_PHAM7|nr:putative peroxin 22-like protein [Phaeoacremonium minimum UCRPA7]EON96254.1 putative peroxin 22-like protein [Phaeoacremonium minimum UCRPA7]